MHSTGSTGADVATAAGADDSRAAAAQPAVMTRTRRGRRTGRVLSSRKERSGTFVDHGTGEVVTGSPQLENHSDGERSAVEAGPGSVRLPPSEPLVDRLPRPISLRQVTPRSTSPQPPQHPIGDLPVPPRPSTSSGELTDAAGNRMAPLLPGVDARSPGSGGEFVFLTCPRAERLDEHDDP